MKFFAFNNIVNDLSIISSIKTESFKRISIVKSHTRDIKTITIADSYYRLNGKIQERQSHLTISKR